VSDAPGRCPFCPPEPDWVFHEGEHVLGIWDAFPASPGHALLVPRRHVAGWFDASPEERRELMEALDVARSLIETKHEPDGYNIGVNVGAAAGQTVFHLHVHIIPRYDGDVPDPRGGIRLAVPHRGNYLLAAQNAADDGLSDSRSRSRLVRGGEADPLFAQLVWCLDGAESVDMAVAFIMKTGVAAIEEHLRDVLDRGGRVRILTGDYLGVTDPSALLRLLDLQGDLAVRVYEAGGTSFHPKAFVVTAPDGSGTAFVGSSNLSEMALRRGIEWNYRVVTARDSAGFRDVVDAFESLWSSGPVREVDEAWVREYERRRIPPPPRTPDVPVEPPATPPEPHEIQRQALAELEATRAAGNTAGLVVLATGLGKTWLSAFDSQRPEFERVLFVAHREEILGQAMRTYRAIRPMASLGYYTGRDKDDNAEILFASIQTLGRRQHLERFDPRRFDYIVVDEFHHAAAQTYRRLIGYFEPRFLLGLTATPERTDGGDLLALCGNNLVYRCDVADGIRRELLSPFAYYGVPDIVDYQNIPWRSNRFDEEALTNSVATQARAENALDQHRRLGGKRTIGFCVSLRHADFMAGFFSDAGLRAVAVHSGPSSAPRAHSLERLDAGDLDVVFAVDMFNEGVDLPNVDTILMLRPTESRILWLQQFGRGLRHRPGKTLSVIDYIGNHRVFLTKTRALFSLGSGDREVAYALDQLDAGTMELPPGCSVTYDLEAVNILRSLLRPAPAGDQLREYYEDFRERNGARPLAAEAFDDGLNPRSARRSGYGSWLDFVAHMGDLSPEQQRVREQIGPFLERLEVTQMTKSYKMLVLLAMIGGDRLPGSVGIDELTDRFGDLARRYAALRNEVGPALEDRDPLRRLIETNPIDAWAGGRGTGGTPYFDYADGVLSTRFTVPEADREAAQDLARELAEWRLMEYVRRRSIPPDVDRFSCNVSHANGRPILFLPSRDRHPDLPFGWQTVLVDGEELQANFVKIALNVVTRPGSRENLLPEILRRWFGPNAGQPGRSDAVIFRKQDSTYVMEEAGRTSEEAGPVRWERYSRIEAAESIGEPLQGWENQSGIVRRPGALSFFVTLDKDAMAEPYQYRDRFLSATEFEWQSQNQTAQASKLGRMIREHREKGIAVHLFVRRAGKIGGRAAPFLYCGRLEFQRWEGERPITVWWTLEEKVPEKLWRELDVHPQE
jgi:superfamily II DNA or RNA helicase/diadenosine tetraphosphate (Ap4A) HIT family hydrolase/HKD family nuclease